uniref:TetR/AcrR family transcriptional regulator n=1 Tax=uncultured Xylophilus sp. TaxID=296832 RepID=UPI0025E0DD80
AATPPPALRPDGAEARDRLLRTALRLFSEQGFARTSTRAIAQAAGVNLAAIRYYFGDKAGLYRATFTEPLGAAPRELVPLLDRTDVTLRTALQAYFGGVTAGLKQGELARQCLRLHIREMLEPTDQWAVEVEQDQVAPQQALVGVLRRHLGLAAEDDDLHRLAFGIAGLGVHLFVAQDMIGLMRPALLDTPEAVDAWTARLVDQAMALVAAERARRRRSAAGAPAISPAPARARATPRSAANAVTPPSPRRRRMAAAPATAPAASVRPASAPSSAPASRTRKAA